MKDQCGAHLLGGTLTLGLPAIVAMDGIGLFEVDLRGRDRKEWSCGVGLCSETGVRRRTGRAARCGKEWCPVSKDANRLGKAVKGYHEV